MDKAVSAAGETHPTCDSPLSQRRPQIKQRHVRLAFVFFWDRRILGLGDLCLRLSFLVEVQRPAAFQSGQCSSHAAFLVGRAGQLPCCFSSGQCSIFCLFGATGTLAVPGGWTSPPHCELRTILPTTIFCHRFFRVNGLCTLGPHSFLPHSVWQPYPIILAAQLLLVFLCYAKNSLFCFRPFPEVTLLARRR